MNHHLRILQEGVQTVAISSREIIHNPVRAGHRQGLERAFHEVV